MTTMMWCRNRAPQPDVNFVPLFFYHVPKTGGLSLFHAWRLAIEAVKLPSDVTISRMDAPRYPDSVFQDRYFLVAAHQAYGFHLRFKQSFNLVTIVRDPVRRVVSEYTYDCMRAQQRPTVDGLLAFVRHEANRNVTTKMLSGLKHNRRPSRGDAEAAIGHLTNHFCMYGTTKDIQHICECFLTAANLCNILMGQLNKTLPEYQLDASPYFEEISALNELDTLIFEFVKNKPRFLPLPDSDRCHRLTGILGEIGDARAMVADRKVVATADILPIVKSGDEAAFMRLFEQAER